MTSLVLRDMFNEEENYVTKTFDRLFNNMFSLPILWNENDCCAKTYYESNENQLFCNIELPGIRKENLKVTVGNNIIKIKAKKFDKSNKEIFNFNRSLSIPSTYDPLSLNAELSNGILEISINKKKSDDKEIEIKIK